jgi:hypothetical protein
VAKEPICRQHFGAQLETFAEWHTGSQAPNHRSHAGLQHQRRSMMTTPTGDCLASPKVSRKCGMQGRLIDTAPLDLDVTLLVTLAKGRRWP